MKIAAMNSSATSNTHPLQDSHENPTSPAATHPKYSASTAPITSGTHAGAQKARPVGHENATDEIPSVDWDLGDIWYATSENGFHWEEQGPAATRPPKGEFGWRSNCTPDILVWKDKYYLYHQAYSAVIQGGDSCPVTIAHADSPHGPWTRLADPL